MLLKKRRKSFQLPQVDVNVISLMDILTTLLFFLLLVASFTNFSSLKANAYKSVEGNATSDKPIFALQVSLLNKNSMQIELAPTHELEVRHEKAFYRFTQRRFKGNPKNGFNKKLRFRDQKQAKSILMAYLKTIKKGFPEENKVVLAVSDRVEYQQMIHFIETMRESPFSEVILAEWQG
jgi:biopolymer transport protein ExbD